MEEILGAAPGSLKESDSRDTVQSWSSLEDVNIVTLIQSEFGFEPDPAFVQAETVGDLLAILHERGAFSGS
jgi:acyl carrier protein